jgi:putative phosphoribosyl transferase
MASVAQRFRDRAFDWLDADATAQDLPVGCFGASTGAAAALIAAAERPGRVGALAHDWFLENLARAPQA